jgi:hypothetical protein
LFSSLFCSFQACTARIAISFKLRPIAA